MDVSEHIYIDGPHDVFRLEGQINGLNKMIYLFADVHHNLERQTKCSTYDSTPIYNYIYTMCKEFDRKNIKYDLFGEMSFTNYSDPKINNQWNEKYIRNYMKMLRTIKYQKMKEHMFKNIRIHYTDPREYLDYQMMYMIHEINDTLRNRCFCNECTDKISNILAHIEMIIRVHQNIVLMIRTKQIPKYIEVIRRILNDLMNNKDTNSQNNNLVKRSPTSYLTADVTGSMDQILERYIDMMIIRKDERELKRTLSTLLFFDKLLNRFNNESVKKLIVDRLSFYYLDKTNEVLRLIDRVNDKWKQLTQGVANKLDNLKILFAEFETHIDTLSYEIVSLYTITMDIYFIKRFIDKDYVERGIMYCGGYHVAQIIYYLVRYLGFVITHTAKNNKSNHIDTLNQMIRNNNFPIFNDVFKLLFDKDVNAEFVQCVDMINFPKKLG